MTRVSPLFRHPLIVLAMEEEERALLAELGEARFKPVRLGRRLAIDAQEASMGERSILVARSGMGSVNAALTVAAIAEQRDFDAIILLGVGGALVSKLNIGDLVVSDQVLQHDSYSSLDFGHPRMNPGELILTEREAESCRPGLSAHSRLVEWLSRAKFQGNAFVGAVLSGSEFVGTVERKRAIASLHEKALLVEMEAAGVAQAAQRLGVPFVVAKTVADRLQPDGTIESDFRACLEAAASNAAVVLRQLLEVPSNR